ncbi:hypothetical protein BDW22DRAFT_128974 [Trametopsis cervina]|nr:hypothetical protein BDW22DRAFT_128974 [Trametopsis cervina]
MPKSPDGCLYLSHPQTNGRSDRLELNDVSLPLHVRYCYPPLTSRNPWRVTGDASFGVCPMLHRNSKFKKHLTSRSFRLFTTRFRSPPYGPKGGTYSRNIQSRSTYGVNLTYRRPSGALGGYYHLRTNSEGGYRSTETRGRILSLQSPHFSLNVAARVGFFCHTQYDQV